MEMEKDNVENAPRIKSMLWLPNCEQRHGWQMYAVFEDLDQNKKKDTTSFGFKRYTK